MTIRDIQQAYSDHCNKMDKGDKRAKLEMADVYEKYGRHEEAYQLRSQVWESVE